MELSHRVVIVLCAQVQRKTNKKALEMSSRLKFESMPSRVLLNKLNLLFGYLVHKLPSILLQYLKNPKVGK